MQKWLVLEAVGEHLLARTSVSRRQQCNVRCTRCAPSFDTHEAHLVNACLDLFCIKNLCSLERSCLSALLHLSHLRFEKEDS